MNDKQKAFIALMSAGALAINAWAVKDYVKVIRTERQKRKKIKEWETMNLACVANYRERIMEAYEDDSVSIDEFWQIIRDEMRFLLIVREQPMY